MKVWSSLLKKEYLLNRTLVLGGFALLLIGIFFDLYLHVNSRYPVAGMGTGLALMAVGLHIWYLPIYVFTSLSKEWKHTSHLWLHLPQSGWQLLASKIITGLGAMLVSFGVTSIFALWIAQDEIAMLAIPWPIIIQYGLYLSFALFIYSLYMALWAMMFSVTMATVKRFLKKGTWLAGLLVLLIPTWGLSKFVSTKAYSALVHWGVININLPAPVQYEHALDVHHLSLYTGEILFYILLMAALFYLSGWLLDRKVEV